MDPPPMSRSSPGIQTVWRDPLWVNIRSGRAEELTAHETPIEAIDRGRELAMTALVEHVVYGKAPEVVTRVGYGSHAERLKS